MIQKHSDDPNVEAAARHALGIITAVLAELPKAERFDYAGQQLALGEYDVCTTCTTAIAEAQQAEQSLKAAAKTLDDPVVKEHVLLAAQLYEKEAQTATIRAEFHNGHDTEPILNALLGFAYERGIGETYEHSHRGSST
jgi:hypothetical protein